MPLTCHGYNPAAVRGKVPTATWQSAIKSMKFGLVATMSSSSRVFVAIVWPGGPPAVVMTPPLKNFLSPGPRLQSGVTL